MVETKMNKVATVLGALAMQLAINALSGAIVMLLWNWLIV